ncbi:MAG: response regulator [Ktedonobacteraceae bacterium]|nr:response regulator [Ktedonobacteraceae bacterium]
MSEISPHILIIDDDPAILELMSLILEGEGNYRVTAVEIVFEDVAAIERLQPDLILLDFLTQGRQTGWTLLQKLKLYRPTKDIPVVLCTAALQDVKEQEPVLTQKGIPILYKPFDVDELLHVVEQALTATHSSDKV